ncbi:hypothetical protein KVT40_008863 [Elsinoe batatas]|uniref:Aminoglycoside phosphotransferase domain-containing protein n=1 Tax=Elsinoe batatas TaxID=2601811 RepID=A0A8K0KVA0_9PEZI|nr:hypothetical protein KVT40_008863 [Elsinoe batatas]
MDFDDRVEEQHYAKVENWFQQLKKEAPNVDTWISTFRHGDPCTPLKKQMLGSFNWCFTVRFFSDNTKWVVRFAMPGKVMDPDGKLIREVATLRFLKEKTSIPVPTVHGWGTATENPLGLGAFVIMDFIEGVSLVDLWSDRPEPAGKRIFKTGIPDLDVRYVYRQISSFLLEQQDFPFKRIGSLAATSDGTFEASVPPLTHKMQEINAHAGIPVGGGPSDTFTTTTDYFNHVASLSLRQLEEQANSIDDAEDGRQKYINQKRFEASISRFVDTEHDNGSTYLTCDDFRLGNMLVRSETDLTIVAVLDWEWSYAAPYQMFASPPRWLVIDLPYEFDDDKYEQYTKLLDTFLEVLDEEESKRCHSDGCSTSNGNSQAITVTPPIDPSRARLSTRMRRTLEDGKFWFHELLQNCYIGADNEPWWRLTQQYPDLLNLPVDEQDVEAFVARKMKDKEEYDADRQRTLACREHSR